MRRTRALTALIAFLIIYSAISPAQQKTSDAERQLRGLINLPIEDGQRLVPSDAPTLAHYRADWKSAEVEALSLRPELILSRQDIKFRQFDLIAQKNLLKPDLRFIASYDINGLGTRLDGAPAAAPTVLLDHVADATLRFRYAGAWSDRWDGQATQPPLPQALELSIRREDGKVFRQLFLVGTGYDPRPPESPNAGT